MSRGFDGGNDRYLVNASGVGNIFDGGSTFAARFYPSGWGESGYGRLLHQGSQPANDLSMQIFISDNDDSIQFLCTFDESFGQWRTPISSISLSSWQNIVITYDADLATNDPIIYLGGSSQTLTDIQVPLGTREDLSSYPFHVGTRNDDGTINREFDGYLAEMAFWDAILDAAEADSYAQGKAPWKIRPVSLAHYWRLFGRNSPEPDIVSNLNLTLTNSPTTEVHPPIIWSLPKPSILIPTGIISGEITWGHDTGVLEANVRDFSGNWTGTGAIAGAGDAETLDLETTEYMISEVVNTGTDTVTLLQNEYDPTGDDVDLDYRHGADQAACEAAGWNNYTIPFVSLGYVQVRMTSTL